MARVRLADQIREALEPLLDPGEDLRSVSEFSSGGGGFLLLPAPGKSPVIRTWWVGITDKRVIFGKRTMLAELDPNRTFSAPPENVVMKGNELRIASPDAHLPDVVREVQGTRQERLQASTDSNRYHVSPGEGLGVVERRRVTCVGAEPLPPTHETSKEDGKGRGTRRGE